MTIERIREQEMAARLAEIDQVEQFTVGGTTVIHQEVISALAKAAANEVEGVSELGTCGIRCTVVGAIGRGDGKTRGVTSEVGRKEAIVDLDVTVQYGASIPNMVIDIRKKVAARLLELAGIVAKEINVNVVGIEIPDRLPRPDLQ